MTAWRETFSVGIQEFDDAHKQLFAYADELSTAVLSGKGNDVLATILMKTRNYTIQHFSTEEIWMATHSYPDLAAHKVEHKKFIEELRAIVGDSKSGSPMATRKTVDLLNNWLENHILGTDQKYAPYAHK
jgi:hemerythrin